jgi:hypothetical protein
LATSKIVCKGDELVGVLDIIPEKIAKDAYPMVLLVRTWNDCFAIWNPRAKVFPKYAAPMRECCVSDNGAVEDCSLQGYDAVYIVYVDT